MGLVPAFLSLPPSATAFLRQSAGRWLSPFFTLFLGWSSLTGFSPAEAMDCAKPKGQLNKVICGDKNLRAAEKSMSWTYFGVLAKAPDEEARNLLQAAQRRWVAAREEAWGRDVEPDDLRRWDDAELAAFLTKDTRQHAIWVEGFYAKLEGERAFAKKFTGGPFAGASVECFRAPKGFGDGYYFCQGSNSMQNGDRVCTEETGWASGHITSYQSVKKVKQEGLVLIATCTDGYSAGRRCPGSGDDDEGWEIDTSPGTHTALEQASKYLPKFAPELDGPIGDSNWMQECLTSEIYPKPEDIRLTGQPVTP